MARAYGHPRGRFKIITMEHGFHGRTMAAVSATAQPKYHEGFEPLLPGFTYVPHNDLEALAAAIDDQTTAVMIEPIQGEGGVNLPAPGYLEGIRRLCDEPRLAADLRRGSDRHGANRRLVRAPALRRHSRYPHLRQGPGGRGGGGGDDCSEGRGGGPQTGDARQHLWRQPDRLPSRDRGDRNHRGRRPARPRPSHR